MHLKPSTAHPGSCCDCRVCAPHYAHKLVNTRLLTDAPAHRCQSPASPSPPGLPHRPPQQVLSVHLPSTPSVRPPPQLPEPPRQPSPQCGRETAHQWLPLSLPPLPSFSGQGPEVFFLKGKFELITVCLKAPPCGLKGQVSPSPMARPRRTCFPWDRHPYSPARCHPRPRSLPPHLKEPSTPTAALIP